MDFAIVNQKSSSVAWEDLRSKRKKKQRRGGDLNKRAPSRIPGRDVSWTRMLFELTSKLFLAGVVVYLFYASYSFLTSDPRFQITDVTFRGNHALSENQLSRWLGQVRGGNLFAYDLSAASTRLAEHPWIFSASVQRKFPRKIQIELTERVPYARVKFDKVFLIDRFGVLLSEATPEHRHLPLIIQPAKSENFSEEKVVRNIETMRAFNKLSFFEKNPLDTVERKGHSRIIFFTRNRDLQIQMSTETLTEGFKKFMIVLDTLEYDASKIQMIDLSFEDQVVVRDRIAARLPSAEIPTN